MEWLDLERNAAILEKTDRKIAEKLRAKASADSLAQSGGGGGGSGTKSSALKVRIFVTILQCCSVNR